MRALGAIALLVVAGCGDPALVLVDAARDAPPLDASIDAPTDAAIDDAALDAAIDAPTDAAIDAAAPLDAAIDDAAIDAPAPLDAAIDAPVASHLLTVTLAGTGIGTVASNPAGIACGPDCSELYPHGATVVLTATPGATSLFLGWSGGGCTGTGTCTVSITAATTVSAAFAFFDPGFTVARAGPGTGTVTSSPAGINCGTACSTTYPLGTVVTLTATPSGTSVFAGWTGAGCAAAGTGPCTITVSGSVLVTATFNSAPAAPG